MRYVLSCCAVVALTCGASLLVGQALEDKGPSELKQLFPEATGFSSKGGQPPHFTVFGPKSTSGDTPVVGLAFWTTDLEPLERGYGGPITILVGMNTNGILSGIVVTAHREPYGGFSIATPAFAAQFVGKDIRDPFRVGEDIDAVSRATISVASATRAVRNSARRAARALLPLEKGDPR